MKSVWAGRASALSRGAPKNCKSQTQPRAVYTLLTNDISAQEVMMDQAGIWWPRSVNRHPRWPGAEALAPVVRGSSLSLFVASAPPSHPLLPSERVPIAQGLHCGYRLWPKPLVALVRDSVSDQQPLFLGGNLDLAVAGRDSERLWGPLNVGSQGR